MLVLSRKKHESIVLALDPHANLTLLTRRTIEQVLGQITVTVCRVGKDQVRLGIDAPDCLLILREELIDVSERRVETREQAAAAAG